MAMTKDWLVVGGVVAVLAGGLAVLTLAGPEKTGVAVGMRAPDYRMADLTAGDSVSLRAAAKDHVTLVNIWATWCGPCKEEMPAMQRLFSELQGQGFKILAVSIDQDEADKVSAFTREMGLTFDILHDKSGNIQQVYQTTGVPESFLLDRDGTIIKRVIGSHDWASVANRRLIERYLGGEAGAPADSALSLAVPRAE